MLDRFLRLFMVVPILFLSHHSGNEFRAIDFAFDSVLLAVLLDDLELLCGFVVTSGGARDKINNDDWESALTQTFFGSRGISVPCF